MAKPEISQVRDTTIEVVKQHVRRGSVECVAHTSSSIVFMMYAAELLDLGSAHTPRMVRKEIETLLKLEPLTLDSTEYKSVVKAAIVSCI